MVVVQLVHRDREASQGVRAQAMADALAVGLSGTPETPYGSVAEIVGRRGVRGARIENRLGRGVDYGDVSGPRASASVLANGDTVALWFGPVSEFGARPLANLLRLYLFFTGAAILLLAYVALTRLIVRPVEVLTQASERLARGAGSGGVDVRGAAEVARLATSFNHMSEELGAERKALETRLAELEQTTCELEATQAQLVRSEKLASVGRLSAGIAHEIGNPLAAILGLVELLQMGVPESEQQEFLARIHAETDRIHHIIRDLLDYSRHDADEGETGASADLETVVEDAVKLVAPQKDLRGVTIERRFVADLPRVQAPAHQLTQVVLNLLLNAADAVQGEGTILVEVERGEDSVTLRVSDTGPGIAAEVLSTLFDPFVTTKPAGEGSGLGLSVCHSLIERAGGSLTASNTEQGGAVFCVTLLTV